MRKLTIALLLAVGVLAFAAAGCGGSDEASSDEATPTTLPETVTDETTETTEETGGTETTSDLDNLSGECADLLDLSGEFTQALGAVGGGGGTADLGNASDAFEAFADQVPEEIRDDFKTVAAAFTKYAEALKDIDFKPGEVPDAATLAKLQDVVKELDQTEVQQASDNITAWTNENC